MVVPLPQDYDAARELYETLVPAADLARFHHLASWQATLELAEINAPNGFMVYQRLDLTALMAGSKTFWRATQYLMGNHTIAERMFRVDPAVMLHAPLRVLIFVDPAGTTNLAVDQPSTVFDSHANPDVRAVGDDLDRLLSRLMVLLGAAIPPELGSNTSPTHVSCAAPRRPGCDLEFPSG
jgi:uncharacterized protein (DUF302 family)